MRQKTRNIISFFCAFALTLNNFAYFPVGAYPSYTNLATSSNASVHTSSNASASESGLLATPSNATASNATPSNAMSRAAQNAEVVLEKRVDQRENGDYILTLESYISGEVVNVDVPSDITLILDQSASMYTPIGAEDALFHDTLFDSTKELANGLERYVLDPDNPNQLEGTFDLREAFESDAVDNTGLTFKEKIKQRGYLVAQSRSGGSIYCETHILSGTGCYKTCPGRTYDWFVVEYREDDTEKPWYLYRVESTTCPSEDSKRPYVDENKQLAFSHTADLVRYSDLDAMGDDHFYFYKTQYGALFDSMMTFINELYESEIDHRISVIGFASEIDTGIYREGSGIYIDGEYIRYNTREYGKNDKPTNEKEVYQASTISPDTYANALMSIQDDFASVSDSVKAVFTDYYGTCPEVGVDMANHVFEYNPISVDETRNRVMILFTDGTPSSTINNSALGSNGVQNWVVDQTYKAKTEYNATVFTVCTSTVAKELSSFLDYMSSDYPDVNSGNFRDYPLRDNPTYTKRVTSPDELLKTFKDLSSYIEKTAVEMYRDAVLKDVVSDYFDIDYGKTNNNSVIKVYASAYAGVDESGNDSFETDENGNEIWEPLTDVTVEVTSSDHTSRKNTIKVKGFNYAEEYIRTELTGEPKGRKLIVQIPIIVRPGFLGGNNVPTNKTTSTLLVADKVVGNFPVPEVNTPININLNIEDTYKVIKHGDSISHKDLFVANAGSASENGTGNIYLDSEGNIIPSEPWMDDFVNFEWVPIETVDSETGETNYKNPLDIEIDNTKDGSYTYKLKITPKYDGEGNKSDGYGNIIGDAAVSDGEIANGTGHVYVKTSNDACLTIEKLVVGSGIPDQEYKIAVQVNGIKLNEGTSYEIEKKDGRKEASNVSKNGTIRIQDGDKAIIQDVTEKMTITVQETAASAEGFKVSYVGIQGSVKTAQNQNGTYAEAVVGDGLTSIRVINREYGEVEYGSIQIVKKIRKSERNAADGSVVGIFKITGTDIYLEPHTYYCSFEIDTENGEYLIGSNTISNIPLGTYNIEEISATTRYEKETNFNSIELTEANQSEIVQTSGPKITYNKFYHSNIKQNSL